ncbi:MAG: DUF86 domain-containing protein [Bacteroidales bacterium]|nr:DUF86 domain-containing protein [Bacteroidales bacterium]MCD8393410.1 DUF86 domain-containing protein [Bacteroidales bacterium]
MDERINKYLLDVLQAIEEVEMFYKDFPNRFDLFVEDLLRRKALERNVEIMGEAVNRIKKVDPDFAIPNARAITGCRNRVIHGYDSVDEAMMWSILTRHLPILKQDIKKILNQA